ncbi:MAG: signal peptidase II [Deltaproteobacteria bacterium]|nr:MAG: signal peptidase II [Deltaproteobacteria bacterium]
MPRRYKIFLAFCAATIALDQVTKLWARRLPTDARGYGIPQPVIDNFWDWRLSFNTGSAFGLFHSVDGARIFLSIVAVVAVVAIVWMLVKAADEQRWFVVALGLVAGGAIGNLIDRIAFGKVTDFIVWKYHEHEWPTFNIADAALCVGVGLMFLSEFKKEGREPVAAGDPAD